MRSSQLIRSRLRARPASWSLRSMPSSSRSSVRASRPVRPIAATALRASAEVPLLEGGVGAVGRRPPSGSRCARRCHAVPGRSARVLPPPPPGPAPRARVPAGRRAPPGRPGRRAWSGWWCRSPRPAAPARTARHRPRVTFCVLIRGPSHTARPRRPRRRRPRPRRPGSTVPVGDRAVDRDDDPEVVEAGQRHAVGAAERGRRHLHQPGGEDDQQHPERVAAPPVQRHAQGRHERQAPVAVVTSPAEQPAPSGIAAIPRSTSLIRTAPR